jgi:hypothetical protein
MMGTRLQRDKQVGLSNVFGRNAGKSIDFGVRTAKSFVPTTADLSAVANDDTANHRIRFDATATASS